MLGRAKSNIAEVQLLESGSQGLNQSSLSSESALIPKPGTEPGTALQLTKFYNTGSVLRSEEDAARFPAHVSSRSSLPACRVQPSPVTLHKQQAPLKRQETS